MSRIVQLLTAPVGFTQIVHRIKKCYDTFPGKWDECRHTYNNKKSQNKESMAYTEKDTGKFEKHTY